MEQTKSQCCECVLLYPANHTMECNILFYVFIFIDNAAIHHTRDVVDALNATGALVVFLPPYSPDYMPCEELFSQTKHFIRSNDIAWQNCPSPEVMVFESFLHVTDNEIKNYIEHAGYV